MNETPWTQLREWLDIAMASGEARPRSFALATADDRGRPHVRFVDYQPSLGNEHELGFVTHFRSDKGRQLDAQPWAAACFHWASLHRQLRLEGPVTRATDADSDRYHHSRQRESQLTAWATRQSETLADYATLEAEFERQRVRFEGQEVPRPPHWGGYVLQPERIEFWRSGANRLHHRELWQLDAQGGNWRRSLLSP